MNEWIIDSRCFNYMIGEKKRLQNQIKYKGSRVVVIADNSNLAIAYIGNVVFLLDDKKKELKLPAVYHILRMKKNILYVNCTIHLRRAVCCFWT